jgi:AraC-like DNA-binding protein
MYERMLRHESPAASVVLAERGPHPGLGDLVQAYEDFEERTSAPLRRRELPIPGVVLILDLGDGWTVHDEGRRVHLSSFAAGMHDRPSVVEHAGSARCVQVNLTPLGARALLGRPLADLANRVVALEDLLGRDAHELVERLHDAPGRRERFALIDEELLRRAEAARPLPPDVTWAWRRLVQTGGGVAVAELAAELGCSRRHLTGRFGEELGLPPKVCASLLRFRRAVDALLRGGEAGLAAVAAACGYADQSHLNREFRRFAGATPGSLLAERHPGGAGTLA